MDPYVLDLSLEVVEGAIHDCGHLTVYCRLRANTFHPLELPPELVVLQRGPAWEWLAAEPKAAQADVATLVREFRTLGFPGRLLQVEAAPGNPTGWQEVFFRVILDGKEDRLHLLLRYGGLKGPDGDGLRAVWQTFAQLAGLRRAATWIVGTQSNGL